MLALGECFRGTVPWLFRYCHMRHLCGLLSGWVGRYFTAFMGNVLQEDWLPVKGSSGAQRL